MQALFDLEILVLQRCLLKYLQSHFNMMSQLSLFKLFGHRHMANNILSMYYFVDLLNIILWICETAKNL